MTIEPTPHRYRVDACEPRSDPRRMATIRDVLTESILTVTTEDEARHLIAQLTAWLDAPRLAARKPISSCAVIDVDYSTGVALIKSKAGEWGVIDSDGLSHAHGWLEATGPQPDWYATEAEGRAAYRGETGAQVEQWRTVGDRLATIAGELFGPFPVQSPDEDLTAIERGAYDGIRAAQELAAIRDLVAPGNPQGTVVDAVRALRAARDDAIARAEKAEADLRKAVDGYERVTLLQAQTADDAARLRARVAELEARPVLTAERLTEAIDAAVALSRTEGVARKVATSVLAALGHVTLPPDRADAEIAKLRAELAELRARIGQEHDRG